MAYQLCQQTLPLYWHPKSLRRYTVPQLVACLLLMRRLRLSYRDMEQLLWGMEAVRTVLGLSTVTDHTTLQRAFARLQASTWHLLLQCTADVLVKDGELCVAADSTGFVCTQASLSYQTRRGRLYTGWRKGVYVVGCASRAV